MEIISGQTTVPVELRYRPWSARPGSWKETRFGAEGHWEINRAAGNVNLLARAESEVKASTSTGPRWEVVLSITCPSAAGMPFSTGQTGWARTGGAGFAGFFTAGLWVQWRVTGTSLW